MRTAPEVHMAIASRLITIYNRHKVPESIQTFAQLGFTREGLIAHPSQLYQLLVCASYDRWPFTMVAGGWGPIWSLSGGDKSLPFILRSLDLFDLGSVEALDEVEIEARLQTQRFFNYRIATDGSWTRFARTLREACQVTQQVQRKMILASNERHILEVFRLLLSIHGIGATIAAKVIMYTLRELNLGGAKPADFPRPVVRPLLGEYHNTKACQELEARFGAGIVDRVVESLFRLGDPMAVDSLYYIDRARPELRAQLFEGFD